MINMEKTGLLIMGIVPSMHQSSKAPKRGLCSTLRYKQGFGRVWL